MKKYSFSIQDDLISGDLYVGHGILKASNPIEATVKMMKRKEIPSLEFVSFSIIDVETGEDVTIWNKDGDSTHFFLSPDGFDEFLEDYGDPTGEYSMVDDHYYFPGGVE